MALFLKNKIIHLLAITAGITLLSCSSPETKTQDCPVAQEKKPGKISNPNGDSELALLMREMYDSLYSYKNLLADGRFPAGFPERFLKIHTARPTEELTDSLVYHAFASDYVSGLNYFYEQKEQNLKSNYNSLVLKCANCHENYCPGPLDKIRKLNIK